MKAFAEAASDIGLTYSAVKCGREGDETPHPNIEMLLGSSSLFNRAELPDLVGGTAWLFSKAEAAGLFDYLFVDEAGQVCVANLAGMAPAARNIVLLGDQMQLNQPIQGVHPGESGQSVLEYLLEEHATVPPNRGIFLPETWRMRPEICRFISDGIYESRLQPNPITSHRRIRFGSGPRHLVQREAGLVFVPVDHDGNTHECPEECDVIREIVAELTAHEFQASDGTVRKLGLDDILVVAPFNLQVRRLAAALPGVRVGTVDKFQGQQAPVVIFSVTSSDGDGSPRGIDFLFDKHRLNVAISRAQVLAVIVGSPRLERTRCSTLEQMKLVNLYCRAVGVKAEAQSA
jgi:uncharacterized protein